MIGYWGAAPPGRRRRSLLAEAEQLGFDSAWTAEAYGSDALTPLAWWGRRTKTHQARHVDLPARRRARRPRWRWPRSRWTTSPGAASSSASARRARRWWRAGTASRTRSRWPGRGEYVEIIRKVLAREEPVTYEGEHYPLPYPGGAGLGKPVKSITHPLRADLPIYLAAEGPKNVALERRDRRRLARDLLLAPRRRASTGTRSPRASPGRARAGPRTTSRSRRRCPSSSTTTSRRRPSSCARCSRSTSAAWARGR